MSFSELRSSGPRLPAGKLNLPAAVEWVGYRVVVGWTGAEREAAARADEGIAVANHFECAPEPSATGEAFCAVCGDPATRMIRGRPYCSQHGNPQPIPERIRELIAKERGLIPALASDGRQLDEQTLAPADPAAVYRWADAHAALKEKVLSGKLRAAVRKPGGKTVYLDVDQWRTEGFPTPYEARARLSSHGHVEIHVIFDATELDRAFAQKDHSLEGDPLDQPGLGRPSMRHLIMREMEQRAAKRRSDPSGGWPAWHKEAGDLSKWAERNCGERTPPKASTIERELRRYYRELSTPQDRGN